MKGTKWAQSLACPMLLVATAVKRRCEISTSHLRPVTGSIASISILPPAAGESGEFSLTFLPYYTVTV